MRKLIMKMSVSLDGFVSDANGKNDWVFKSSDETSRAWSVGQTWEAGLIIMGRKTFESIASYWPTAPGPFAPPMNEIPKALFTKKGFKDVNPGHTSTSVKNAVSYNAVSGKLQNAEASPAESSWGEAQVFEGDLAEGIRELKAGSGKPILAIGGAGFMQSLLATGLIDEYQLIIHPVALGSGLPIFTGLSVPLHLKLVDVKTFPGGIVTHIYGN